MFLKNIFQTESGPAEYHSKEEENYIWGQQCNLTFTLFIRFLPTINLDYT